MATTKPAGSGPEPANRIREWRLAAGLTQEELAERVGTTGQSVGRYEAGSRSVTLEMLEHFARALGCRPADLLPDPESALGDRERALLTGFKHLDPEDQATVVKLLDALLNSAALRAQAARPAPLPPVVRRWN